MMFSLLLDLLCFIRVERIEWQIIISFLFVIAWAVFPQSSNAIICSANSFCSNCRAHNGEEIFSHISASDGFIKQKRDTYWNVEYLCSSQSSYMNRHRQCHGRKADGFLIRRGVLDGGTGARERGRTVETGGTRRLWGRTITTNSKKEAGGKIGQLRALAYLLWSAFFPLKEISISMKESVVGSLKFSDDAFYFNSEKFWSHWMKI